MEKKLKTGNQKIGYLFGPALLLLTTGAVFSFQKEIKKQLITLRDRTAIAQYPNFHPGEDPV